MGSEKSPSLFIERTTSSRNSEIEQGELVTKLTFSTLVLECLPLSLGFTIEIFYGRDLETEHMLCKRCVALFCGDVLSQLKRMDSSFYCFRA